MIVIYTEVGMSARRRRGLLSTPTAHCQIGVIVGVVEGDIPEVPLHSEFFRATTAPNNEYPLIVAQSVIPAHSLQQVCPIFQTFPPRSLSITVVVVVVVVAVGVAVAVVVVVIIVVVVVGVVLILRFFVNSRGCL